MTDVLQRYGIKEVADVTFYHIDKDTNKPDYPVLVLDSLKVTSIEQTAETSEARGGKGNAKLIVWDFGKEITVNIEDALFSPKSLAIMMGEGNVSESSEKLIRRSARVVCTTTGSAPEIKLDGKTVKSDEVFIDADKSGTGITFYRDDKKTTDFVEGQVYFAVWYHPVASKSIITITPDSFPGTYYVTGDTMVRSERNGEDEYFQFIIPKAKMQAEQKISMESEGDPSTFNMSLQVLRPESGNMIEFIQYGFEEKKANNASDGWADEGALSNAIYFTVKFINEEGNMVYGATVPGTGTGDVTVPTELANYWNAEGTKQAKDGISDVTTDLVFYEKKPTSAVSE